MTSHILTTATRYLVPLMLLFSLFVLYRGHNQPGGGFVGGLVASAAFALYTIAYNVQEARKALKVSPRGLIAAGNLRYQGFVGRIGQCVLIRNTHDGVTCILCLSHWTIAILPLLLLHRMGIPYSHTDRRATSSQFIKGKSK